MDKETKTIAAAFALLLVTAVAVWVVASAAEAAAFKRVTGRQVSLLDAMFLELRVQEEVQP